MGRFGYGFSTLGASEIVLGRYPTYIEAGRSMGAGAFNMPNWLYRGLHAIGEGWTANRVFIDTAVRLGRQIYLSNSPSGQASAGRPGPSLWHFGRNAVGQREKRR